MKSNENDDIINVINEFLFELKKVFEIKVVYFLIKIL